MGAVAFILALACVLLIALVVDAWHTKVKLQVKLDDATAKLAKADAVISDAPQKRPPQESFDKYPPRAFTGAQLRRMNEQFNAQVSREMEPRSNSEILKEQANG